MHSNQKRKYEVSDDVKAVINDKFYGGFCDDKNTEATIHEMFEQDRYLCDTHTAVAINVYKQYVEETGDKTRFCNRVNCKSV